MKKNSTPDPVDIWVGAKTKMGRRMRGISQKALATNLGVSYQQVQKYETGKNRMGSSRLWQLAQLFEVSISFFFDGLPTDHNQQPKNDDLNEISRADSIELIRHVSKINNPETRKIIRNLARSIVAGQPKTQGE